MPKFETRIAEQADGWVVQCGHVPNVLDPDTGEASPGEFLASCFRSAQWPTKKTAAARAAEHDNEHATGAHMTPLSVFRRRHNLEG